MKYTRTLFRVLLVLGMIGALVFARDLENGQTRYKTASPAVANGPALTTLNINNIEVWVRRDAALPPDGPNGSAADYPKGITNMIYAEGLVWGVRVYDGLEPVLRVGGSTYASGMKAGKVLTEDGGSHWVPGTLPGGTEIEGDRHVWRVRVDWKSTDLADDAASFYQTSTADAGQVAVVTAQYEYDWLNWPATDGAPYNDLDEDGVYTPATWDADASAWVNGDIPGFPGADQTLWTVANDLPYKDGAEVAPNAYGSPGVGFEEQLTIWGYNFPASFPLGNIQFKRARMIYTGRPGGAVDSHIDTAYFTQWSDPDLGTYTDDYVGFDTTLGLAYVYNGNTLDATYNGVYGLAVPAGGYDFLQGPKVDGVPLGMTTTGWFGAGSNDSDPDLEEYSGTLQWWNLMEGYRPRPAFPARLPWIDNITGLETKFPLVGDPVTGVGDIDGISLGPGDRRLLMNSGPFAMALGDTQDVVLALIGATGGDNISSITVLRYYDKFAQYAYDLDFDLPSAPAGPSLTASASDGKIVLNWGGNAQAVDATENTVSKGFEFQGYKIYQLPTAGAAAEAGKLIGIYDVIDGVGTIVESVVDAETGFLLQLPVTIAANSGITRYLEVERDVIKSKPLSNDIPYYFGVSAYSYLEDNENSPFKSLESSMTRITVRPAMAAPGDVIPTAYGDDITAIHAAGTGGGVVSGAVIDPLSLTGHDYKVWFNQAHYYRDVDGKWKPTAFPDAVGKASLSKYLDCSGSTVTAVALASEVVGTFDLIFTFDMDCGSNWVDGIMLDFPDGLVINSWDALGENVAGDQNCVNMEGTLDAGTNSITWGNDLRGEYGCITGNLVWTINVQATDLPLDIAYTVYDDVYDGTLVDAFGTASVTELGYSFETINQWNLLDVNTGKDVVTDQTIFGGVEYTPESPGGTTVGTEAGPLTDGFQLDVAVGFASPTELATYTHIRPDGSTDVFDLARANAWLNYDEHGKPFILLTYGFNGWAATSRAIDTQGHGQTGVDYLQRDYEVRFTGVYGDPIGTYIPVVEGGSMAVINGARGYDLATHPDPANPGNGDPFFIQVPFEVWDMEAPGGPQQINILIYDREANPADAEFYAFNPVARMYTEFIAVPYDEVIAMGPAAASVSDFMTWNIVWYNTQWTIEDIVHFAYDNPTTGTDEWTFSTVAATSGGDVTDEMVDMINVFPNPYYGFHELETTRRGKYVTFNHLPQRADIRIFNMGGVMVRKIEKDDDTQLAEWDLNNQYALPVASGVYIAHIDLPDVGKEKILKIALIQEEQILLSY